MSKGLAVRVIDLKKKSCKVQCFNKHYWMIHDEQAFRVVPVDDQLEELFSVSVEQIFSQIRSVWIKGEIVARWNGEQLVTVGKSSICWIEDKRQEALRQALAVYQLTERLEYELWVKEIQRYWYNKEKRM